MNLFGDFLLRIVHVSDYEDYTNYRFIFVGEFCGHEMAMELGPPSGETSQAHLNITTAAESSWYVTSWPGVHSPFFKYSAFT